jgi:hypothetical protein
MEAMAMIYSMPTFRSATEREIWRPNRVTVSPKGTTARMTRAGMTVMMGARMKTTL